MNKLPIVQVPIVQNKIENKNKTFSRLKESANLEESVNLLEESVRQLFILFDNKEFIYLTRPTGRKTLSQKKPA